MPTQDSRFDVYYNKFVSANGRNPEASDVVLEITGSKIGTVQYIKVVDPKSSERLGYPTQKPIELLRRIIETSSNEGDLVLDPFCGCGTTVHSAEELKRRRIGIDISAFAAGIIRNRIVRNLPFVSREDITVISSPSTLNEARDLAMSNPFEFDEWVCGEIGAEGMFHNPGKKSLMQASTV